MKPLKLLSLSLLPAIFLSCAGMHPKATGKQLSSWLNSKAGPSNINLTGTWDAYMVNEKGYRGTGQFEKKGNRFSGTLGTHYADAAVNGDEVYMIISYGSDSWYTAQLKTSGKFSFSGRAVQFIIIDSPEAKDAESFLITLKVHYPDIVYLVNGGMAIGTILQSDNQAEVKIRLRDGREQVFAKNEIEKIAHPKETSKDLSPDKK